MTPDAVSFAAQADAVLYLGCAELLTASRAEPALYQGGEYAEELRRMSQIAAQLGIRANLDGLSNAGAVPRFFKE